MEARGGAELKPKIVFGQRRALALAIDADFRRDREIEDGELLEVFGVDTRVLAFEDGFIDSPKPAMVQRIAVRNAAPDAPLAAERCRL